MSDFEFSAIYDPEFLFCQDEKLIDDRAGPEILTIYLLISQAPLLFALKRG